MSDLQSSEIITSEENITLETPITPSVAVEQPISQLESEIIDTINDSEMNSSQNPDITFQAIIDSPEESSPSDTQDTPEKQNDSNSSERSAAEIKSIKEQICSVLSQSLSELPESDIPNFVAQFNQEHKGILTDKEFTLLKAQNESLVIVDENGDLKEIPLNKENSREVLTYVKSKDKEIKGESHALRSEILHRSEGTINTYEAYTYDVDLPKGDALDDYLENPLNWTPESRALNNQIIELEYQKALTLSDRLEDTEITTYAVRGNIASGKTTAIRENSLFRRALDSEGQASGAIAPDVYKHALRASEIVDGKNTVDHRQVHIQSAMISRAINSRLLENNTSILMDKMMHEQSSIDKLLSTTTETERVIRMIDLDAPLETSCLRVLTRSSDGMDPLIPFDSIAEGYKKIRENRAILLDQTIRNNPKVKEYTLWVTNQTGTPQEVLSKINGQLVIFSGREQLFEQAISSVPDSDITSIADTIIDEAYIERSINNTPEPYRIQVRNSLEKYNGYTIKQALDIHSGKNKLK